MIIIALLFLFNHTACQQPESTIGAPKSLRPLSYWLVENEDSLFFELSQRVNEDTFQKFSANETLISKEYQFESGYVSQLTNKIHSFDSCIKVHYRYKPEEHPSYQILLSARYNKKCISSIDNIFSDVDSLEHLRIVKYLPPGGVFSAFIVETDTLKAEEIRFEAVLNQGRYNLEVFVNKKISEYTKEALLASVFGEEVRLKKLAAVRFIVKKNFDIEEMTLEEVRILMGVKE